MFVPECIVVYVICEVKNIPFIVTKHKEIRTSVKTRIRNSWPCPITESVNRASSNLRRSPAASHYSIELATPSPAKLRT